MTESARYRFLGTPTSSTSGTFVAVGSNEPISIDLDRIESEIVPGFLLEFTLDWQVGDPAVVDEVVLERTVLSFVDGASNLFEAALDTWETARRDRVAVNSRLTYDTTGSPVGAVYTFAQQRGERDLFEEFRTGTTPLEPLLQRAASEADPPFEAFVMRPIEHPFVLVYIVFEKCSILSDTVRDTYEAPRPRSPHDTRTA